MFDTVRWARHSHNASTSELHGATLRRMHQGADGSLFLCAWNREARVAAVARWTGQDWARWGELSEPLPIDAPVPVQDLRVEDDTL